mmetsp:Transcript_41569/g.115658  ORF Transcript_41569/g.115658 Transcript_41569/m.115658 type:complete len:229 (-) Transcript_41569:505-1191(-)
MTAVAVLRAHHNAVPTLPPQVHPRQPPRQTPWPHVHCVNLAQRPPPALVRSARAKPRSSQHRPSWPGGALPCRHGRPAGMDRQRSAAAATQGCGSATPSAAASHGKLSARDPRGESARHRMGALGCHPCAGQGCSAHRAACAPQPHAQSPPRRGSVHCRRCPLAHRAPPARRGAPAPLGRGHRAWHRAALRGPGCHRVWGPLRPVAPRARGRQLHAPRRARVPTAPRA